MIEEGLCKILLGELQWLTEWERKLTSRESFLVD